MARTFAWGTLAKRAFATAGKLEEITSFVAAEVDNDLQSVPGIGPATVAALAKVGVKSTTQLIGQFLLFVDCDDDDDGRAGADRFVAWLRERGVLNQWVNTITYAIAAKADAMIPGTFTVRV